jgi:ubiquinone/menaquinone biosynthesis C-methylase UbiE
MNNMDNISKTNRERWNALARANLEYTRPFLDYSREEAAQRIFRHDVLHDVSGKSVLCLASGGGQDSVAFGLLGAEVSVLDLSDIQLERDRQGMAHHNLPVTIIQGDMRDLSPFADNSFDIVWQIYSINFVPSVDQVFSEVARVLKSGGVYFLQFANPFVQVVDDSGWDGEAFPLKGVLYKDHQDITQWFPHWDVIQPDGTRLQLNSPHEYRHTLGTLLNTMLSNGFRLMGLWEWMKNDENPEPGSWEHFTRVAPPWFDSFWSLQK